MRPVPPQYGQPATLMSLKATFPDPPKRLVTIHSRPQDWQMTGRGAPIVRLVLPPSLQPQKRDVSIGSGRSFHQPYRLTFVLEPLSALSGAPSSSSRPP